MNPKIKKVIDEIDRTKAKILELQILLPELERKRIDMENTEIIKLIRSADILPTEIPAFIESLKAPKDVGDVTASASATAPAPVLAPSGQRERGVGSDVLGEDLHGSDHPNGE